MLADKLRAAALSASGIDVTFVGASAVNGTVISVPTGSEPGDLLILFDRPVATSTSVVSGFSPIIDFDVGVESNYSMAIGYRIMQSGDSSLSTPSSRKIMAAFRPSRPISDVGAVVTAQITNVSTPKNATVNPVTGFNALTFVVLTQSTGTTTHSPTGTTTTNFHIINGDVYLGAWFGINETSAISATDSTPQLMKVFGFYIILT